MRVATSLASLLAVSLCFGPHASAAVESQAHGTVESLPAAISRVFRCGSWAEFGARGEYRIVFAEVSGGAGTEVYIQRLVESLEGSDQILRVVTTTPVRELNNDHQQYRVSAARCVGKNSVELMATYEHDEGNIERRIRLVLSQAGTYRISNVIVSPTRRSR
jgi:hypothetical protein